MGFHFSTAGISAFFLLCSLSSLNCASPLPFEDRTAQLDAYALAAPPHIEGSITQLAEYLTKPAQNEKEKIRLIYRWITDRIEYDVDAYLGKVPIELSALHASDVLSTRKSVCEGYAALFDELARMAGVEVARVPGFVKGLRQAAEDAPPNHVWTAVKLDGQWHLIDSTWGAGRIEGDRFRKNFSEQYFLVPADQLQFTHYPADERWQLQTTGRLSRAEFEALPALGPTLFTLGFHGGKVWSALKEQEFKSSVVQTFDVDGKLVQVSEAPIAYDLRVGQDYEYRIRSSAFEKMAVIHNSRWVNLEKSNDIYSIRFAPDAAGNVSIAGKLPGAETYTVILAYRAN